MAWGSIDLFAPPSAASSIILTGIEVTRWNGILAFEKFLKAEEEQERLERGVEEEDADAEGEVDPDIVCSFLRLDMEYTDQIFVVIVNSSHVLPRRFFIALVTFFVNLLPHLFILCLFSYHPIPRLAINEAPC
jgi:hypothetical protein